MNINEFLILEKRISQIVSTIEVTFAFDVIKTKHAEQRQDFASRGLETFNDTPISNAEMAEFVNWFKREIAQSIVSGDIVDQTEFIIKSKERNLSMAIIAEEVSLTYWKLIIKTLFRESDEHSLRTGTEQLVLEK